MTSTSAPSATSAAPGSAEAEPRSNARSRDFQLLLAAAIVNNTGTEFTFLALPLTAVLALHASAGQVGLLGAAGTLAFLIVGLPSGVWVDRHRRRRVMIAADTGTAIVLGTVPVAWWLGGLTIGHLVGAAFLTGICRVFFDVAAQSYLPSIVGQAEIVDANAKLSGINSASRLIGRSLGGYLIARIGGPAAFAVNSLTALWSALCVTFIRHREEPPAPRPDKPHLRREVVEGLRYVTRHPVLRAVAVSSATLNLFVSINITMLPVLFVDELHLSPAAVGVFFAGSGAGAVVGSTLAPRMAQRLGYGRMLWLLSICIAPLYFLLPLADRGAWLWIAGATYMLMSFKSAADNVVLVSFRQRVTPHRLLGRMNATMRFVLWGTIPVGAALAGLVGELTSPRTALWVGVTGMAVAWIPAALSPLRAMRTLPPPATD
ncbi:MFS transporter [Krasilnikovia sp. MM14-A1259]|uniref:MFS transporter n=1 Tax=Krasilnikovia sp. MM14-A1259 TaxID=3373539 RepID=UPI003821AFA9